MGLSKKPYRGSRDFFPTEKRIQDYLFQIMRKTAESFGYEAYDGPMLEEVELYKAKSGDELISNQIYDFKDRGGRHVAIRPEMTPTVARMVAQVHRETTKPIRWYSIPNLWRYEKPQRGRVREHWQFNCDIFGASANYGESEIIQMAISLFKNFGANHQHFEILINDREVVDCIFSELMKIDVETQLKLYKVVDKSKKVPKDALDKMITALGITAEQVKLFHEYLSLKNFDDLFSFLDMHKKSEKKTHLENLCRSFESIELLPFLRYDATIVRGLDYYTGIVFEIFDKNPENPRALCGGGTYANLLKIFNENPLPGTGFGLGDVTLRDFLKTHDLLPDLNLPKNDLVLTAQVEGAGPQLEKLALQLRQQGLNVVTEFEPVKIKKVFSLAEKKGATFVGLIGENELKSQQIQIKNLKTRDQKSFAINDIEGIKVSIHE